MENEIVGTGTVVISGSFECRDKDGVLLKTIEIINCAIPLADLQPTTEEDHGTELGK